MTHGVVRLRRLGTGDLEYLYRWENDPEVWRWGDCGAGDVADDGTGIERFSRNDLRQFIENQQYDISITGQLRLVICLEEIQIGFIDLYDYDPAEMSAGVGILICDPILRGKGCGRRALALAESHARRELGLHTLWCRLEEGNTQSRNLFTRTGYQPFKKDPAPEKGEVILHKSLV
jgi:diamine N-acetyltransferase